MIYPINLISALMAPTGGAGIYPFLACLAVASSFQPSNIPNAPQAGN